ncbi:MAG: CPBP family intramembrane metalloprotease [Candidatus Lokiarchaeota archaeon]|nr:CPBP family intramembrane metalloprotease [Candidatus Lokiarchaeota archaeon]
MERFFLAVRSRPWLARLLPSATYIGTSAVILLASGPWAVSAAGWDIYVGAVVWTVLMLVLAVVFVRKAARLDLQPLSQHEEPGIVLAAKIAGYFFVILSMRQLMIWQFYNPWEKLPLVFLVLLQVAVVEGTRLDDLGLRGWNKRIIALAAILAGFEIALLNVMVVLFHVGAYGPGIIGNLTMCCTCQLYWLSFPYQFLAVAFGEELFFRGYVYTKLRVHVAKRRGEKASFWGSIAITNVLFGLFHVPWYVGNWLAGDYSFDLEGCLLRVAGTAIMGVGLTYIYEKTGSLAAPMLAHGFSNSIQPLVRLTGVLPSILPGGRELLACDYILIGIALLAVYIAFTRWYVRRTGGPCRSPPGIADSGK